MCEIYYKQDNQFKAPQATIFCIVHTNNNGISKSAKSNILAILWTDVFQQHINELSYLALTANLKLEISFKNRIDFTFSGFNDSMENYVKAIFEKLCNFNCEEYESVFNDRLEKLIQQY